MTAVPLDQLFGLVTNVRDGILADYATDADARMIVQQSWCDGWVLPLLSCQPGGPVSERPRGAVYFWQTIPVELQPNVYDTRYQDGCGCAGFVLLPRMPRHQDQITELVPDIKALASISVGKHIDRRSRYTFVSPEMPGKERMIHYLPLLPVAIDMLTRFSERLKSLPEDLDWSEDVSHLFRAA